MRFHIVIKHAKKAHDKEIERNVNANVAEALKQAKRARGKLDDRGQRVLRRRIEDAVRSRQGAERAVGTVHDTCDTECPDGEPNCRNCGDPAFAESCAAAGHCPHCGTKHGLAPDSVVAANGYELVPVT